MTNSVFAKPNIILFYADDLGYADLSCYGATEFSTPHIDQLAEEGVKFSAAYVSAPVCSPSRAGLMTGRYQQRFGFEANASPFGSAFFKEGVNAGLAVQEKTMGDRLKALGYTTATIGKWHLGESSEFQPTNRGFDEFYGSLANPYSFYHPPIVDSAIDLEPRPIEEPGYYMTDALADRAVDFIERHRDRPFFVYLPFNAVHTPLEATPEYLDRVASIEDPDRRTYAAMAVAMDDAVGKVLTHLRKLELEENTLVIFMNDNGGTRVGNNHPLRDKKTLLWEGGIRVALIMKWKDRLPEGITYEKPVIQLDILPTLVAAAGGEIDASWKLDGVNLLPFLTGGDKSKTPHENLYWRYGPSWAIRSGKWKLIQARSPNTSGISNLFAYEVLPTMLFNLETDIGEQNDVSGHFPEVVEDLMQRWEAWNAGLEDLWFCPVHGTNKPIVSPEEFRRSRPAGARPVW